MTNREDTINRHNPICRLNWTAKYYQQPIFSKSNLCTSLVRSL